MTDEVDSSIDGRIEVIIVEIAAITGSRVDSAVTSLFGLLVLIEPSVIVPRA